MSRLGLIIALVTFAASAAAEVLLQAPSPPVQAGRVVTFAIFLVDEDRLLPSRLDCRLQVDGQRHELSAEAQPRSERDRTLGRFPYNLLIPPGLSGPARLDVLDLAAVAFDIAVPDETDDVPYRTLDSLFRLYQPYLSNIAPYEPVSFLVGTDPEESRFQLSFRYRFFNPGGSLASRHPWISGLNFGYTQTSFWDLESDSLPFEDTSYKPEFFHVTSNLTGSSPWLDGVFLKTGLQHESNGKSGDDSRSTNTLYVEPIVVVYRPGSRLGLAFAPRLLAYFDNSDDGNPDLPDYRGYVDLKLTIGKADGLVVSSSLRFAKRGTSWTADLTYPLHRSWFENVQLYAHLQYTNSLAESLLFYRERTRALRLGLSVVR